MGIAFRYRNPNEPLSRIIASLNRAREIINSEITKNSVSAKDMDEDNIMALLNIFEPLCLKLRNALELKTYEDKKNCMNNLGQEFEKRNAKKQGTFNIRDNPVEIENTEDYIHIRMPLTLMKDKNRSYYLADYLKAALDDLKAKGELIFNLKPPFSFIVIRKTPNFKSKEICDNDNFETSALINTLFRFLNTTDSPTHMDFVSCYRKAADIDDVGLHIYLVTRADFEKLIDGKLPKNDAVMN